MALDLMAPSLVMQRRISLFVMALGLALSSSLASRITDDQKEKFPTALSSSSDGKLAPVDESSPAIGMSRFLPRYNPRATAACDRFPRICRAKGSPGRHCCRKRCVNLKNDNLNCGRCSMRCRFGWACCGGKCVNATYDPKNCGSCKLRCKKGSICVYGMCSYA